MMTRQQYLLLKLAEEASEIAQIALKTAQFGMTEKHPELEENNQERIHAEINDLMAIVGMLNRECNFGYTIDEVAGMKKIAKVNKFHRYSQQLGMVEP